jgi:hypothetical protein
MECREFEIELQDRLDLRQDPRSPALQAHAAGCEACATSLASAKLLLRGVAAWKMTLPTVELAARIASQLVTVESAAHIASPRDVASHVVSDRRSGPVYSGPFAWGLVTTSAAALCFMFCSTAFQPNSQSPLRNLANRQSSKSKVSATAMATPNVMRNEPAANQKDVNPNLNTVLASAGQAYSHLALETAAVAEDFALLMPAQGFFRDSDPSRIDKAAVPSNSNGLLPETVYPVGDSVENALQYLWQAVPGTQKAAS